MDAKKAHRWVALLLIVVPVVIGAGVFVLSLLNKPQTIKVGILHSMTGHMAVSERGIVDATLHAIQEINDKGGILGQTIEPIIVDGQSDPERFAYGARRLITQEKVSAIFGCWTSSSRKAVKPIVEQHNNLLFYPVQYEGLEESKNIIYTGLTASQQVIPGVTWALRKFGQKMFLVGSDYIYSHAAHEIIKSFASQVGGNIVGEEYIAPGNKDVFDIVEKIKKAKPNIIINTINGTTNKHFFIELRSAGVTPETTPTISFSIAEEEAGEIGVNLIAGDYAVWSYFQSLHRKQNRIFLNNIRKKYGPQKIVSDAAEAGYTNIYLWADAVAKAGSSASTNLIKKEISNESIHAPQGVVLIDGENFHAWKKVRIAKIKKNGEFLVVWNSERPIKPVPFPFYKSKEAWQQFLLKKYNE